VSKIAKWFGVFTKIHNMFKNVLTEEEKMNRSAQYIANIHYNTFVYKCQQRFFVIFNQ
jgi:hypothetical protein